MPHCPLIGCLVDYAECEGCDGCRKAEARKQAHDEDMADAAMDARRDLES